MIEKMRKGGAIALMAAAAMLAACGGGSAGDGPTAASAVAAKALVTQVEAYRQPDTAPQDVTRVKSLGRTTPVVPAQIHLEALEQQKTAPVADPSGVAPRQVGVARAVGGTATPAAMQQQLQWKALPDGGTSAAVSVSAEGAYGVRLGVLVQQLPGSAILRVYSQARPSAALEMSGQEVLQLIERNQKAGDASDEARTWWTPDTGGDEATLEIELPAGTPSSSVRVSIPRISHIFENLSIPTAQEIEQIKINESDPCNLDSTCYDSYANLRNAVARMLFTKDGLTYACTGTLLNDRESTGTPYFISANHCISSQTVASTLNTDWFYRSPSCNSRTLSSSSVRRTGGATLLYATANSDTSFMRLNDAPPAGAVFAGWDASEQAASSSVVGVHHPQGDLQKISFGTISGQTACASTSGTQFQCTGSSGNFYRVNWSMGTTEGGSSGSGIFRGNYLVGTLYGGSAVCSNKASADFYGRFDVAYNAAIKNWLSPASTAVARTAVYRFYNAKTGAHFYTASANERDFVIRTFPEFNYEKIAFYAYPDASSGKDPVFRFYNDKSGAHFYSGSVEERDYVIQHFPDFRYEVISWYAQKAAGNNASPIYRFYNDTTGAHFYTISAEERDFVIQVHKNFRYEGPMYYAWTSQ